MAKYKLGQSVYYAQQYANCLQVQEHIITCAKKTYRVEPSLITTVVIQEGQIEEIFGLTPKAAVALFLKKKSVEAKHQKDLAERAQDEYERAASSEVVVMTKAELEKKQADAWASLKDKDLLL